MSERASWISRTLGKQRDCTASMHGQGVLPLIWKCLRAEPSEYCKHASRWLTHRSPYVPWRKAAWKYQQKTAYIQKVWKHFFEQVW